MAKWQREKIDLPSDYTIKELKAIGADLVDHIIKRTEQGKGENGRPWRGQAAKYSEAYKKSFNFKIAGKSKSGPVNLTLTGDMLSLLDTIEIKKSGNKSSIVIGYPKGDSVNGKVEGNRIGSYGREPNPNKARDFLALGPKDIDDILRKYPLSNKAKRRDRAEKINEAIKESRTYKDVKMAALENSIDIEEE